MSWEAFRLTSKSPSELYDVLGPEGVDNLMRQFLTACWNALPSGTRSMDAFRALAQEIYDRNMRVWSRIKRANPVQFFEDLRPEPADGHLRQAMVLSWMMLPRAGGRNFSDTKKIIAQIYQRNLEAWAEDDRTFSHVPAKKKTTATKRRPAKAPAKKPSSKKKSTKKR